MNIKCKNLRYIIICLTLFMSVVLLSSCETKDEPFIPRTSSYELEETTITMGMYPQNEVIDKSLCEKLNEKVSVPNENDSNGWTNIGHGGIRVFIQDVTIDEDKYRGVYLTEFYPYVLSKKEDIINENDYYQKACGYDINTIFWFKFEPVVWRILQKKNNNMLLMSEKILDACPFDENNNADYSNSTLKRFINTSLYDDCFSEKEKNCLVYNGNSCIKERSEIGEDKVFILNLNELSDVDNDIYEDAYSNSIVRERRVTSYAGIMGCIIDFRGRQGGGFYWTLDCLNELNSAFYIDFYGSGGLFESCECTFIGVCPAIEIYIE